MIDSRKWLRRCCGFSALLSAHQFADAQVVVTYGPLSSAVPTLSEWGTLALAALLAAAAVMAFLKGSKSHRHMSWLLGTAALLAGSTFFSQDAQALFVPDLQLLSPTGGTLNTTSGGFSTPVTNMTGVPQRILTITPTAVGGATPCAAGITVLSPAASCTILTGGLPPG